MNLFVYSDNHATMPPSNFHYTQVDQQYDYTYHNESRETESYAHFFTTSNNSHKPQTGISQQSVQNVTFQNGSQILNENYLMVSWTFQEVIEESFGKQIYAINYFLLL